jgi:hypothetical protein
LLGLLGGGKGGGGMSEKSASGGPPPPPASAPAGAAFEPEPEPAAEEAKDDDAEGGMGVRRRAASPPPKVEITVRTRMPDTSLWAPRLQGTGSITFEATLPETVGPQELMVVASDKAGGVGVARKVIRQELPLWAELDRPARLTVDDRVSLPLTVHNHTGKRGTFTAELVMDGQIAGKVTTPAIDGGKTATVAIDVAASRAGSLPYRLSVRGSGHEDTVEGNLRVFPAGVPDRTIARGTLSRSAAWRETWTVGGDEIGTSAVLRVAFPGVTSAFVSADVLASMASQSALGLGSNALAAARVLRHARSGDSSGSQLAELEARAIRAVAETTGWQRTDGSFGYWRTGKPSAFVTAFVLEGLLEARALGLPGDDRVIQRAAQWLASDVDRDGLATVDDIAFWQGGSELVRMGVTSDVFVALASMPSELRTPEIDRARGALQARFSAYLEGTELDALVAGRAVEGLARLGELDRTTAKRVLRRLLDVRNRGHWEPTWFHAYGGNVEATVAMIVAMNAVDPEGFARELRDATRWLLATRDAWGLWHNERGTAAAIAGLLAQGPLLHEVAGTVIVRLDGEELERLSVDPADPWLSTIRLAHLTLSDSLPTGAHTVEVEYEGLLEPAVELVTTRWLAGTDRRLQGGTAGSDRISVAAPSTLGVGDGGTLEIDWSVGEQRTATVLIPTMAAVEVDLAALERSVGEADGPADVRITEHGLSLLVPTDRASGIIRVPLLGRRPGTTALSLGLRTVGQDGTQATLPVRAGTLRVATR